MEGVKKTSEFDSAVSALPCEIRSRLLRINPEKKAAATEIRFRAGRRASLTIGGKAVPVDESLFAPGDYLPVFTEKSDIAEIIKTLCDRSVYAKAEELREGYLTYKGGHRAGVSGTAVVKDGRVSALRDVTSINIRVARFIDSAADGLLRYITDGERLSSLLLASPPGGGKTTALRALARRLSERGKRVAVVDERGEASGFDLGENTDILSFYPKAEGIITAVRSLSPDVVICDEAGGKSDIEALLDCFRLGAAVVVTVHAASLSDIASREAIRPVLKGGGVSTVVVFGGADAPGVIREAARADELFS